MRNLIVSLIAVVAISAGPAFANDKLSVDGEVLIYDTILASDDEAEITSEDVDAFREILAENQQIKIVRLNSNGGRHFASVDISHIIVDHELDTVVDGECSSACVVVFLAGKVRTMTRGSKIGFHQYRWSAGNIESYYEDNKEYYEWETPFQFSSWIYGDTQTEIFDRLRYMTERGVSAEFAIKTLENRGSSMWYPRRFMLKFGGVLRD